jgi:hypothetical protein
MNSEDEKKFSQHEADVLALHDNSLTSKSIQDLLRLELKAEKDLFAKVDFQSVERMQELGLDNGKVPYILNFQRLLKETKFPQLMKEILGILSQVYDYPVDIEFCANFTDEGQFKINLLQCRPLQTRGLGKPVQLPVINPGDSCFFATKGHFMGGNVRLPIHYVVKVITKAYLESREQRKYSIARQIGKLNAELKGKNVLLIGPGRWGTTTPSLGVPVHFSEIAHMSVICEVASAEGGFMPELSYGSHFFQDLVESGIFYAAIFDGERDVIYQPDYVLEKENLLSSILPKSSKFEDVIHVTKSDGMEIFADIVSQKLVCR